MESKIKCLIFLASATLINIFIFFDEIEVQLADFSSFSHYLPAKGSEIHQLPKEGHLPRHQTVTDYNKVKSVGTELKYIDIIKNNRILEGIFQNFNISSDPEQEFNNCVLGEHDCSFDGETKGQSEELGLNILSTDWPIIKHDLYKKVIIDPERHSSPENSEFILKGNEESGSESQTNYHCNIDGHISYLLNIKDKQNRQKFYGGDYLLARMVPSKFKSYQKDENPLPQTYLPGWTKKPKRGQEPPEYYWGTFIPGKITDFRNGSYGIDLPCVYSGVFRVEVFMIRSSEAVSAIYKSSNTINSKGRKQTGTFSTGRFTERCGPFLPDMLAEVWGDHVSEDVLLFCIKKTNIASLLSPPSPMRRPQKSLPHQHLPRPLLVLRRTRIPTQRRLR